jgi:alpha-L-rhamnosidase
MLQLSVFDLTLSAFNPYFPLRVVFNVMWYGDWCNVVPQNPAGVYGYESPDYPAFYYIAALDMSVAAASLLGEDADAARYSGIATAARVQYSTLFYDAQSACYSNCTPMSQIFALALGLQAPGSAANEAVWSNAMSWWANDTNSGIPLHFGGGISQLHLGLPQWDAHSSSAFFLRMHLQEDRVPGFGTWIVQDGATTLFENWDTSGSRNHIMFGSAGAWCKSSLLGPNSSPSRSTSIRIRLASLCRL